MPLPVLGVAMLQVPTNLISCLNRDLTRGQIFSRMRPFYEQAVSNLDP
jgi:hypothetical protein